MLCLLERLPGFGNFKFEISNLKSPAEQVSRQLRTWAGYLQNAEIQGQRYLTNKGKRLTREAREREEFIKELAEVRNRKSTNAPAE